MAKAKNKQVAELKNRLAEMSKQVQSLAESNTGLQYRVGNLTSQVAFYKAHEKGLVESLTTLMYRRGVNDCIALLRRYENILSGPRKQILDLLGQELEALPNAVHEGKTFGQQVCVKSEVVK